MGNSTWVIVMLSCRRTQAREVHIYLTYTSGLEKIQARMKLGQQLSKL
uniref:Uncharacterized protein n=1 Tax=Rhizophora mucronata TaxID=61149 RepID=A0A2P2MLP6_RHIMU